MLLSPIFANLRRWPACALAILILACGQSAAQAADVVAPDRPAGEFRFHRDPILGTSLDLVVVASDPAQAEAFESAVLAEIERLSRIISTYDPESEVSRLSAANGPVVASKDLRAVLAAYDNWQQRSGGAYNGQLGAVIKLWKDGEKTGKLPDEATLAAAVRQIKQPAWRLDSATGTVTRLTAAPLNLNSLGKGYIIGQALAAARSAVPDIRGAMLDIGGDVAVWGSATLDAHDSNSIDNQSWQIGIADPFHPQDNAPPRTAVRLANQFVATSGSYERYYTIAGRRYSHIFDPRTGQPVQGIASATVVADDGTTANALATTLCVLSPAQGLELVGATAGAQCLIVSADGREFRSPGFAALEIPQDKPAVAFAATAPAAAAGAWPAGYEVSVDLTIKTPPAGGKKYHRPYVVVWVEDSAGKAVRVISLWGNEAKYLANLPNFWKYGKTQNALVKTISRATRQAGHYSLSWDGADDAGKPVAAGTYSIRLETAREGGGKSSGAAKVDCLANPASAKIAATTELEETKITYGPRTTPGNPANPGN